MFIGWRMEDGLLSRTIGNGPIFFNGPSNIHYCDRHFERGLLYVSDRNNQRVVILDYQTGGIFHELQLENFPYGISTFGDILFVTIPQSNTLQTFKISELFKDTCSYVFDCVSFPVDIVRYQNTLFFTEYNMFEGERIITHLNLLDLELVHHDPSVFGPTEDMVRATYVTVMGNQ
jgi:hypothetical protein